MSKKDINHPKTIAVKNWKTENYIDNAVDAIRIIDILFTSTSLGKSYKIGDVVTIKEPVYDRFKDEIVLVPKKDGYGLPVKYMIVAKSNRSGVSMVQKLNSKGEPYGEAQILSSQNTIFSKRIIELIDFNLPRFYHEEEEIEVSVDPDLEDSILTGTEYAPCEARKKAKEARQEAKNFNDDIRLERMTNLTDVKKFIDKTLKKGQIYWTGHKNFIVINSISRDKLRIKVSKNGTEDLEIGRSWFLYKRLYRDRPKSSK